MVSADRRRRDDSKDTSLFSNIPAHLYFMFWKQKLSFFQSCWTSKLSSSQKDQKSFLKVYILAFTASRGYQSQKTPVAVPSSISSPCTLQSRDAFTASWKKFMTQSLTSSKWKASRFHYCSAVETFKVFETWLTYDAWLSQTSTRRWERSGNITLDRKRRPS